MKRSSWFAGLVLFALVAPATAQPTRIDNYPGKVRINSTASDALCVGGTGVAPASSACTGGIYAGALVIGGGTSITSSSNVALLNAANTFTGVTQTVSGSMPSWKLHNTATNGVDVQFFSDVSGVTGLAALYVNGSQWLTLDKNGLLTVSGAGVHTFSSGVNGDNELRIRNTTSGTAARAIIELSVASGNNDFIAYDSAYTTSGVGIADSLAILAGGTGGLSLSALASAPMRFWTSNALRWGINAAGDFTVGASSHIADSVGTPTISGGGFGAGSIAGTDYAFVITNGGANSTGAVVFGHTWSTVPVCTATSSAAGGFVYITTPTTTGVTLNGSAVNTWGLNDKIWVLCRSY